MEKELDILLNLLNGYLQHACSNIHTGYAWYHTPGGLASSGESGTYSVELMQINGRDMQIYTRKSASAWSRDENWAKGSIEIDIIRGVKGKCIPGEYGGGKTYDVDYGVRIRFCPKKGTFGEGKIIRENFEMKGNDIDIRTDEDIGTVIGVLETEGVQIEWEKESYSENTVTFGNYKLKS